MNKPFNVKSVRLDALSIQLNTDDLATISTYLQEQAIRLGDLRNMPFSLNLQHLSNPSSLDLGRLIAIFARYNLRIIAISHYDSHWATLAKQHRLAFCLLPEDKAQLEVNNVVDAFAKQRNEVNSINNEKNQEHHEINKTLKNKAVSTVIITKPVRTGQQVYAENADLIVMALVSEGAEIIADGNIHVYGPLRGRALAGASGNKDTRIFVQSMQAELVSVAGIYRVFDQQLPNHLNHKAVQIYLQEDRLVISAIQAE